MKITQLLAGYVSPDVADSVYQEVARLLQFKNATQTTDKFVARTELLRRGAESEMQMGGARPRTFESALCLQNASLPRSHKSLVLAGAQGYLGNSSVA